MSFPEAMVDDGRIIATKAVHAALKPLLIAMSEAA
jgi:hypothetical protein